MNATIEQHPLSRFLKVDRIPHVWCPGCGLGTMLNTLAGVLEELRISLNDVVVVSGIGCAGRSAGYVSMSGIHTNHGRAIPVATGIKIANPLLKVIVFSGDGDLFAIGGNHFLHAARRNVDMLVICSNNFNYGLTGGQVAPTTPVGAWTTTTTQGNSEMPLDMIRIAAAAGATFVARSTVAHLRLLHGQIRRALQKRGFSFIEVMSQCHEEFGRFNGFESPLEMMKDFERRGKVIEDLDAFSVEPCNSSGDIVLGTFRDIERPVFNDYVRVLRS